MNSLQLNRLINHLGFTISQSVKYKNTEMNKYCLNSKIYTINVFNNNHIFDADIYRNVKNTIVTGTIPLTYKHNKLSPSFTVVNQDINQLLTLHNLYYQLLREMYPDASFSHEKIDFMVNYTLNNNEYNYSEKSFDFTVRIDHPDFRLKEIGVIIKNVVNMKLKDYGINHNDLDIQEDFHMISEIIKMVKI